MTLHRIPDGWTAEQLDALNELLDAVDAYQTVTAAITAAGDSSPLAVSLKADIKTAAVQAWQRLKATAGP